MKVSRRWLALALVVGTGAFAAACGDSDSSDDGSSAAAAGSSSVAEGSSSVAGDSTAVAEEGSSSAAGDTTSAAEVSGSITVWVDAVRLPVTELYVETHPNVDVDVVTYDGDANGATTLQTKIQLWNRTGEGWPDVIFSQQVNDPVWMAQEPFDFAADLGGGVFPTQLLEGWPAPSIAQCTVDGRLVCVQDNLAQEVLWVNQKLMDEFGYEVPTTWQEWAALGAKVAQEHPGYVIGNIGDSYGHWLYLWAGQCPLSQLTGPTSVLINSTDPHCTRMAELLDPLIENGTVPPESVFTPAFAQNYGGADAKVLMMPGPAWYAKDVFDATLKIPAGQMTAAMPLQWESEPVTTGQVGGGPWIVSKHAEDMAAAIDFVSWVTTAPEAKAIAPGYPSYGPAAEAWLEALGSDPYFAASPAPALQEAAGLIWQGWSLVTYPDQPVWSNTVVTQLIAGKSLSSLLPALGDDLAKAAQAAGYEVSRQ